MKTNEKNMFRVLIVLSATVILSACSSAKKSSDVSPVYVNPAPYVSKECSQLLREASELQNRESQLTGEVNSSYESEKTKEVIAWLVFAPAALFYEGNEKSQSELASVMGQKQAIRSAISQKNCYNISNDINTKKTEKIKISNSSTGNIFEPSSLQEARNNALSINVSDFKFEKMNALALCAFNELRKNNSVINQIENRGLKCKEILELFDK